MIPPVLEPRTVIAYKYRIDRLLGSGGMASVFVATNLALGKPVAVKIMNHMLTESEDASERFFRETRSASRVHHPAVVEVFDVGVHEELPWMAMELLEGKTLREHLHQNGPLAPAELQRMILPLLEGLAAVHAKGIVHRDLKPANLFLHQPTPDELQPKVLDFGIAKQLGDESTLTRPGDMIGTALYFSPEQALTPSKVDIRSDLYSIGVILYECLCGRRPHEAHNVTELIAKLLSKTPRSLDERVPGLPAGLGPLVHRCLSHQPETRPQNAIDLAEKLKAILIHAPSSPPEPPRAFADSLIPPKPRITHPGTAAGRHPLQQTGVLNTAVSRPRRRDRKISQSHLTIRRDDFFGRKKELQELDLRITENERMITVMGPSGVGKTRLCQRFTEKHLGRFRGGIWFCDLSDAQNSRAFLQNVAKSLNVPLGQADPQRQLADAIRGRKRVLLILDNFEQLAEHTTSILAAWHEHCPKACFLITSRQRLHITGENILALDPLSTPDATRLFYNRAQAVASAFTSNATHRPVVEKVVNQLEGLPLAIELAAARMRTMTVHELHQRLSARTSNAPSESIHDTNPISPLRRELDWSWERLSVAEQSTFTQISTFRNGCTLAGAEAVVDLSAVEMRPRMQDILQRLVDQSLVKKITSQGMPTRYRLLESIRRYASRQLGEKKRDTELRHAGHFASFGDEEFIDSLHRHGGTQRVRQLESELENLVSGVQKALASGAMEVAARCALGALAVLQRRGPFIEGITIAKELLAQNLQRMSRARLLLSQGNLLRYLGRIEEAIDVQKKALHLFRALGDQRNEGRALTRLAYARHTLGERSKSARDAERGLALLRKTHDYAGQGRSLGEVAQMQLGQGDVNGAIASYQEALTLLRTIGDRVNEGKVIGNYGILLRSAGHPEEATECYREALDIFREVGNRQGEAAFLGNVGLLHQAQGDLDQAQAQFERAIGLSSEIGYRRSEGIFHGNLGYLLHLRGEVDPAILHLQEGIGICDQAWPLAGMMFRGSLAIVVATQGDFKEAYALLDAADRHFKEDHPFQRAQLLCQKVEVMHLAGEKVTAERTWQEAAHIVKGLAVSDDSELAESLASARALLDAKA